jgi:hypothetical protein
MRKGIAVIALAVALGATVVAGMALGRKAPVPAAVPMPYLSGGIAGQLALARCGSDLGVVGTGPERSTVLDAVDESLDFDSRVFVPLYALTLCLVVFVSARGEARIPMVAGIVLIGAAAVFDLLENHAVAATVAQLRAGRSVADAAVTAWPYALLKWTLIAVVALGAGTVNFLQRGNVRRVFGVLLLVLGLGIAAETLMHVVDRAQHDCSASLPSPK